MGRGRIWWAAAALLALAAGGWWLGSPWWTLWRMREAAEARDAQALSAHVEWPALRESTKRQIRERLAAESRPGGTGLDALGAAFASALVGPAVEALVTPEAVGAALLAERRRPKNQPIDGERERSAVDFEVVRSGLSEFRLRRKDAAPGEGELVFRRHGLSWKLEEIELRER